MIPKSSPRDEMHYRCGINPMEICSIADRKYLRYYATLLASIAYNNPSRAFRFHLMWEGSDPSDKVLFDDFCCRHGLNINFIEVNGAEIAAIHALGKQGHVSHHTYYRLLFPLLLPALNKALYLDVDMVVNGSLDELWATDIAGFGAAVVRDETSNKLEAFGVLPDRYFNSGMMLMNFDYWREQGICDRVLRFATEHPDALEWWDQCALNFALSGQVRYVDAKWNCTEGNIRRYAAPNPTIVHFTGESKPWNFPTRSPYGILFANYSQLTPWPIDYFDPTFAPKRKQSFMKRAARELGKLMTLK
jgi:lipopolysaccharide biosynthesis glycosyltransferase